MTRNQTRQPVREQTLDWLNRYEEGLALAEQTWRADESAVSATARAYFLEKLGRADEALAAYREMRDQFAKSHLLVYRQAVLMSSIGRGEDALTLLDAFEGGVPLIALTRAEVLTRLERYEEAIVSIRDVTEVGDSADYLGEVAVKLATSGDTEVALEVLSLVRRITGRQPDRRLHLALMVDGEAG